MRITHPELHRIVFSLLAGFLPLACSIPGTGHVHHGNAQGRWFHCEENTAESAVSILRSGSRGLHFIAAHRGETADAPGNSITAIRRAVESNISLIEIDVRLSPDGTLFLYHDRRLSPDAVHAPKAWYGREIDTLSESELKSLRLRGTRAEPLAGFREALRVLKENSVSAFLIDLKTSLGAQAQLIREIIKTAEDEAVLDRLIIQCQGLEELEFVRTHYPRAAVLARVFSTAEADRALTFSPLVVQGDFEWLSEETAARIHRAGARLLLKRLGAEVDVPPAWRAALSRGADILLTDRAAEMRDWTCPLY